MVDMMQRTMYITHIDCVYIKDGLQHELKDYSLVGKYDGLDSVMRAARKQFGTRAIVVDPDSINIEERVYKMPVALFAAVCEGFDDGWLTCSKLMSLKESHESA